ncbi:UNVERIFIED_ORG: 3-phenylpropionate/trans-cinnamate dioxygenase ferredoxin reductase subunit [Burkholderia sp. 1595]|uniref:3-phenylpropionate/trans-cinnamate dioxygenase ferredoxin reductase subunit n=1 Tax=Paraburkholderia terricola TaxID=169427 RepID=A0ABU1M0I4_9BURK|nr:FAD-dependent oxidoreductase [Paraburkholderia terricola]MDR6412260.1 3-phenylpropionate/trans-cinnamate dioxygenase ferredoxin reductase subunit [Paraburkholderia terricola]
MDTERVIVIGAGHSGCKAAQALRKQGWTGPITMVGKEGCAPYDRPPLSKAVLLGKKAHDQCSFFPLDWYSKNGIDLVLGRIVTRIDAANKAVLLDNGEVHRYRKLLIATGAELNVLPVAGADLAGVEALRTPDQAARIAACLQEGKRIVVIGAGFIGLEVAAAAIEKKCHVEVVEAAPVALGRSLPATVSDALISFHRAKGVGFRFGTGVSAIEGTSHAECVVLSDGSRIPCDSMVYGIGVRPSTNLARDAGLAVENGIVVNKYLQTSEDDIFACGDVTNYFCGLFNQPMRMESWKNAEEQAEVVARNIIGQSVSYEHVPWFWSNQYDLTLQVAGLPALGTRHTERSVGSSKLYLSQTDDGKVVGVCGLGSVREIAMPMRQAKNLVQTRHHVDASEFADESRPLEPLAD